MPLVHACQATSRVSKTRLVAARHAHEQLAVLFGSKYKNETSAKLLQVLARICLASIQIMEHLASNGQVQTARSILQSKSICAYLIENTYISLAT